MPAPFAPGARRRRARGATCALLVALAPVAACGSTPRLLPEPECAAAVPGGGEVRLDPEQAASATTITAVAVRLGLPAHAVTVALATAMQESKLRNLPDGDRDSVGLFQQRPSTGWGTAQQVGTPTYAAAAFYRRLTAVPGWSTMPVTVAAQAVQHSAYPSAYADHEDAARTLARVTTGQVPAGLTCHDLPGAGHGAGRTGAALADLQGEAGRPAAELTGAAVWTAASWLVARAGTYGLSRVCAAGQCWTASTGRWAADPSAGAGIAVT